MLSEEAREFYLASTPEHQLQEYCDFLFVMVGTEAKFFSSRHESAVVLSGTYPHWKTLRDWMHEARHNMRSILVSKSAIMGDDVSEKINRALKIVVSLNEAKGTTKVDGKVVKNEDHIDPKVKIKEMLDEYKRK